MKTKRTQQAEQQNWLDNLTLDEIIEICDLEEYDLNEYCEDYEINPEDKEMMKDFLLTEQDEELREYYWKEN